MPEATELFELRGVLAALSASEEKYRTLFDSIDEGFCTIEVLFDDAGKALDFRFLEANPAFVRQAGFENAVGRTMRELVPEHEEFWFETYGEIARTGEARRFEHEAAALGRFYDVYAFRTGAPGENKVAILFNDISARKRHEARLREADERKSQFLAMLGHELRNPLTAVEGGLKLLQSPKARPESREAALPIVVQQVAHMKRLIDDLLDLARLERGKLQVKPVDVELGAILRASLQMTESLAAGKGSEIRYRPPEEPIRLRADAERLVQVFSNLLGNALKFSAPGSAVDVGVEQEGGAAVVLVRDYGRGIAAEDLAEIFDPFVQSKQSLGLPEGGLGLGLAVSRELVELLGGRISAWSEGLDKGSTFVVWLPLAP
jgi:PAS domain S-box-containing protein